MDNIKNLNIPNGSILGLNYSGMHDSSIAIVAPNGNVLYALSLERVSRVKQDGRFPTQLLRDIPWNKISKVALSNCEKYIVPSEKENKSFSHPISLPKDIIANRSHGEQYYKQIDTIKKEKLFFPHHKCHASSSFYGSGFEEALCLVYDGGMYNEHWFGGAYSASRDKGIETIDLFSTQSYSNITHLYTYITALLGFTPLKHEGKITGLAAFGTVTKELKDKLTFWLHNPDTLTSLFQWDNIYGTNTPPKVKIDKSALKKVQDSMSKYTKEDLAATVQQIAEEHIIEILKNLEKQNIKYKNICLSGGLFANVKINQRVSELGFENIFIAPPMSDDGTALGAAWLASSQEQRIENKPFDNVYLGDKDSVEKFLETEQNIIYHKPDDSHKFISDKLSKGFICAIFQGRSEFGPRSLGNRSIIAQATQYDINNGLNNRLSRTEFMPFAPVIRDVDAKKYFIVKDGEKFTSKFMTITMNCTAQAKDDCPAVVHIDNTARPQIIESNDNPFIYDVLSEYSDLTQKHALVNTSFNIHEEPIVNSYADAIKGFFEARLDYLYLDGVIISLKENPKKEQFYQKQKALKNSKPTTKIIYIDITQLEKQRVNTGIQRVVKEFLQRAITNDLETDYKIIKYNTKLKKMERLQNEEVKLFLLDIKNFKFTKKQTIDIESIRPTKQTIFFDIDSGWNAPYKREQLYPILKDNGFLIFNFLYDMIPILMPQFVQQTTIKNFKPFIHTVYKYSDLVLCDSSSAQSDFLKYKSTLGEKREIATQVTGLGSNFLSVNSEVTNTKIISILNKKYILFVGTLEPRKNQEEVLDAFDVLSKQYPDLNLVFIGMKGWKIDKFIDKIESHSLKDDRLFWLNNVDDDTLYHFYKNAFIVTYLSKYEGYGLPIVESLQHGKITITSKNSSMPEVGSDFAEYITDGDLDGLVKTISKYCDNQELYNQKQQYIKENFKPLSWDKFSNLVFNIFNNYKKPKIKKEINMTKSLKENIKSIPIIGWLARWSYNLLKLNSLKHTVVQQQKQINQQKKDLAAQKKQLNKQQKQINQLLKQSALSELFDSKQSEQVFIDIKKSIK